MARSRWGGSGRAPAREGSRRAGWRACGRARSPRTSRSGGRAWPDYPTSGFRRRPDLRAIGTPSPCLRAGRGLWRAGRLLRRGRPRRGASRRGRACRRTGDRAGSRRGVRAGAPDRLEDPGPERRPVDPEDRRGLPGRAGRHVERPKVGPGRAARGGPVLREVGPGQLVERQYARIRGVEDIERAHAARVRRVDERVAPGRAEGVVARRRERPVSRPPAHETLDQSAVGEVDLAVDVHRGHLRDILRGGEVPGRGGRVARPIGEHRVAQDLLLRGGQDVQVVERCVEVGHEGPDRHDVVAPRGRFLDREAAQRALPRVIGRAPAPQDVRVVEHEQVGAANGEIARHADLDAVARRRTGSRLKAGIPAVAAVVTWAIASLRSCSARAGSAAMRSVPLSKTKRTSSRAVASACSPAVICGIWVVAPEPPITQRPTPRTATMPTNASTATAARRWDSRRDAAGVTRRYRVPRRGRRSWSWSASPASPLPTAARARPAPDETAARPSPTESASGIGERSGRPASGSGGRTGTRRPRWVVADTSPASRASAASLPLPPAATKRWWRCSIAACGCSVTTASLSSSGPSFAVRLDETSTSESRTAISPRHTSGVTSSIGSPLARAASGSVSRWACRTRYASAGPVVTTYSSLPRTTARPIPIGPVGPVPRPRRSRWARRRRFAARIAFSRQTTRPADSS